MAVNRGQKIYQWIGEQFDAGRTVYATTYLRSIKLTKKNLPQIRVSGEHCEVQMGRRWDSINFCKITAA